MSGLSLGSDVESLLWDDLEFVQRVSNLSEAIYAGCLRLRFTV